MIPFDIINQYNFLKDKPALEYMRHPMWIALFKFYNDHHEKKLQMGCGPCYPKVLGFIKKAILIESETQPSLN